MPAAAAGPSIPHYAWAAGHAAVLVMSLYCIIGIVTFKPHPYAYKLSYIGATASWGIVVYKSLGIPSLNKAYLQRALLDENVQYLLLALYWNLAETPIPLTLVPFATFSLFHTLTFIRSMLPKPPSAAKKSASTATGGAAGSSTASGASGTTPAAQQANSAGAQMSKTLQTWIKKNYETAMLFVSYYEVIVIMGRVILGAVTFRNRLITPLFFAHFLRLRYHMSSQTRQAFGLVNSQLDRAIAHPSCPEPVKKGLDLGRDLIIRYGSSILQAAPAGQAQPAAPAQAR